MGALRISNSLPWLSHLCMIAYKKEKPAMQTVMPPTLTAYHDGQFLAGLTEYVEGGRHDVTRIVFGTEPSDEEILRFFTSE